MKISNQISVVVTCYNYGSYLKGCIDSVLNQTIKPFEIIVVDDGSTDNTSEVIISYISNPLVKYIRTTNAGQASAKNTGIRNACGEFVAFLDADDLWHPEKLKKQLDLFEDRSIGVVFSRMEFIDEEGGAIVSPEPSGYLTPQSGRVTDHLLFDNFVPFSSSMVRRECLENYGGFDESLAMGIDWDLWLRLSLHCQFAYVNESLLLYRVGHAGQMSKKLEVRQKCSDLIFKRFVDDNKDRLNPDVVKKAISYTHCSRGYYFRKANPLLSLRHYLTAFRYDWTNSKALVGVAKTMGLQTLRYLGLRNF